MNYIFLAFNNSALTFQVCWLLVWKKHSSIKKEINVNERPPNLNHLIEPPSPTRMSPGSPAITVNTIIVVLNLEYPFKWYDITISRFHPQLRCVCELPRNLSFAVGKVVLELNCQMASNTARACICLTERSNF